MTKPDIGSKNFSKLLVSLEHKPNKNLIKLLDSKMFSLDMNPIFNYKTECLAFNEYSRCLSLFERKNPGLKPSEAMNRIAGVQSLIIKAEAPIKKELEALCISTIKDIYQIPDYIDLKSFINQRLDLDTEQDGDQTTFLNLTLEQKNAMRDSIRLRELHVGLIHGSSMNVWKGVFHLVSKELNKLNPILIELYDYYTSTIGIALWEINPDSFQAIIENETQITQGYSQVKSNREKGFGGTIEAKGINFPVLLHECNKGVVSYLFNGGIPSHYNEKELQYYYKIGDSYVNEPWHYLLSPSLWIELLEVAQLDNEDIPKLINKIVKLNLNDTVQLFHLIQDNKEIATKKIKEWNL